MKKHILLIISLFLGAVSFAQSRIIMDSIDPQTGTRAIGTSTMVVRSGLSDEHGIDLGLLAIQYKGAWDIRLRLLICERISHAIPKGAILLVRTDAGEVFEFTNALDELESRDFRGTRSPNTGIVTYHNTGSYPVTIEQLKEMAKGVAKIRVQLMSEVFDREYKQRDPFGEAIAEHLMVLGPAMAQNKDIRSDF